MLPLTLLLGQTAAISRLSEVRLGNMPTTSVPGQTSFRSR